MSTAKDLFCLSIALFCFLAIWTTLVLIFAVFFGYDGTYPHFAFAFGVVLLSFLVSAKIYHWLVIRGSTFNRKDLAMLAGAILAVVGFITLILPFLRSE